MHFLGLEILIGLICLGMFSYQSILLVRNFNSGDTFRSSKELKVLGPMPSPMIFICQLPGSRNISDVALRVSPVWNSHTNFTIKKIETAFKVLLRKMMSHFYSLAQGFCGYIDSVTMAETQSQQRFSPGVCFPSTTKILVFLLFPGKKVFMSILHPWIILKSVELRKA